MTALPGYIEPRGRWAPASDPTARHGRPWPARPPRGVCAHYVGAPGMMTLRDHEACHAEYRGILRYTLARTDFHYTDIEYNLGACPHGILTELRGLDVEGAAQLDANADYVSVLALMNVADVLSANTAHALYLARIATLGRFGGADQLIGHQQAAGNPTGTDCPGPAVMAWVRGGGADPFSEGDDMERGLFVYEVIDPAHPQRGYVLDRWGGLHPFGGAPAIHWPGPAPSWEGKDAARSIVVQDWTTGAGYLVDLYGGSHPFNGGKPASDRPYWPGAPLQPLPFPG